MLEEVALQRADFAISDLPGRANGTVAEHLCRYHAVCIVQPQHRFAGGGPVALADIAAEGFLSLGEEDEAGTTVQQAFHAVGVPLEWTKEVSLCASACSWVAAAGGVAIVDPFAAEAWQGRLALVLTEPRINFDLWLLRSETKPLSRVASTFLEVIKNYLRSLPGALKE